MSEKHKKVCKVLNYFENFIFNSAVSGCVPISAFASLVGVPADITSSAVGLKMNSHCEAWSYKISIQGGVTRKVFYRQKIPESSCARKETFDIDILVTSRNGDRKIIQSIRIMSRPPLRIRKWNQLSQFRQTSLKEIPIEKT